MISMHIKHPDADQFIDSKLDLTKVTGANISVKVEDDFMRAVVGKTKYLQRFPIESTEEDLGITTLDRYEEGKLHPGKKKGTYFKIVDAYKIWMKIVKNNWSSAEPGLLFWSKILSESPADFYLDFKTVCVNPCGEIPLCPYDSCRLISLNVLSFVKDAFTSKARFDFDLFRLYSRYTQRIMDNIMDLEIECINKIIEKVDSDPEDESIKLVELNLWKKILDKTKRGRRTGIGMTAIGDAIAALGFRYGSPESIDFSEEVTKQLAMSCYMESIDLAEQRGSFPEFSVHEMDSGKRKGFIDTIINEFNTTEEGRKYLRKWEVTGRRNIACNTLAPNGSISILAQTSSGIEPKFKIYYSRNRKTSDPEKSVYVDEVGDMWEIFSVVERSFLKWYQVNKTDGSQPLSKILDTLTKEFNKAFEPILLEGMKNGKSEDELKEEFETDDRNPLYRLICESPYYKSTAMDLDWVAKVEMQGRIQKWIDHSISCTVNLPEEATEELVDAVYRKAWESGCKGVTIYRKNSREGIFDVKKKKDDQPIQPLGPRPKELPAKIFRFRNSGENWIAFIGMVNDSPYEIFCGKVDDDIRYLPKSVQEGVIVREEQFIDNSSVRRYDFKYKISYGHTNTLPAISSIFKTEYWNYARLISGMLRAQIPVSQVIDVIDGLADMGETIHTWKAGVARSLKQFVKDGTKSSKGCENCGGEVIYENGCKICKSCGDSKCG